ncbi:hypothetical protein PMAYCL1PPCAC_17212, partial [Pristionchus mayeri]
PRFHLHRMANSVLTPGGSKNRGKNTAESGYLSGTLAQVYHQQLSSSTPLIYNERQDCSLPRPCRPLLPTALRGRPRCALSRLSLLRCLLRLASSRVRLGIPRIRRLV